MRSSNPSPLVGIGRSHRPPWRWLAAHGHNETQQSAASSRRSADRRIIAEDDAYGLEGNVATKGHSTPLGITDFSLWSMLMQLALNRLAKVLTGSVTGLFGQCPRPLYRSHQL